MQHQVHKMEGNFLRFLLGDPPFPLLLYDNLYIHISVSNLSHSDDSTKAAAAAAATRVRPNRRPSGAGRRSSSKNEGPASSSFLNHPHLNTPAVVAQAVVHQSEGLMEGIVGK